MLYIQRYGIIIQHLGEGTFSDRYISSRYLPDKAIDLVDEVTIYVFILIHTYIHI